ncbi:methylenetetrahydrofolate reductase [NAD(P)H] [endosymbiont of unidentified scaly snail isolate Monju]|uniref:methylenetetrahydrofolate reductase [NAD(P)H] n=1 Tax=endosymbiont of unidentified scaly snail isolate Monju TaxID=1248727 RepID=UPI000389281F|nr:methylenetetrahydrofolate reductase [NAD(P)H] [endosymbiont of unidentified scaly snail isolate Monju]BAN69755.1 methylenetetrahydrofolate reductase (NADPH) [endosymbiont of unidentified scaly snail isolate Monju]
MNPDKTFSFELFPPKTEKGMVKLQSTVARLAERRPAFFSCTYGAGGSTRDRTFATVDWLVSQGIDTAPHLTCIGNSIAETLEILNRYREQGIRRIVALRGDPPSGTGLGGGELTHASELVALIREHFGDHFHIEVAAYPEMHPQAPNFLVDLDNFRTKVEAGADSAMTQYFYNADAYVHFVEQIRARGVDIPIVPGIMPITNYSSLARFSDACGAEIPRWIRKRLEAYGDDVESIRAFGLEVVTGLCEQLLAAGAPGLHFYTMNQADPTLAIWDRLGL